MKKIRQLTFYRLRKDKKQFVLLAVILVLTTIITNLGFTLFMNVGNAYDAQFKEMNTANIHIAILENKFSNQYQKDIKDIKDVTDVEIRQGVLALAIAKDFQGSDFEMQTIFYNINDKHQMNKLDLVETTNAKNKGVYLPLYISELGGYAIDDTITYQINDASYSWNVNGKIQEMQYGNYGSGSIGVFLDEQLYQDFSEANKESKVQVYSIQTTNTANTQKISKTISDYFSKQNITVLQMNYDEANKQSRTIFTNILVMVLFALALIVLFVTLSLSSFKIKNTIEIETANMGVLKALGYTSNEIISTLVFPYVFICTLSQCIGLILSNLLLPLTASLIGFQAGMVLKLHPSLIAIVVTFISITFITMLFTYFQAHRIKRLQPVVAIREGSMSDKKQRHTRLIIVLCLMSILMAFASTFFYNIVIESNNFTSTLSEEMPSAIVYTKGSAKDIKNDLRFVNGVKEVMIYTTKKVEVEDKNIQAFVSEDFSKVANDLIYEGRNPKKANEIAIGSSLVSEFNYQIGDTLKLKLNTQTMEYKIVGFVQSVNFQGNICELTTAGYSKLTNDSTFTSLYVYTHDHKVEEVIKTIEEQYTNQITKVVNYEKLSKTTSELYMGAMKVAMIVISIIILLILWLVFYMVIHALIIKQRKELGIYKAIGYTNKQLRLKLAKSFLPVAIPTIIISTLLAMFYMKGIYNILFQSIGAMKNNLELPIYVLLIAALIVIIQTFMISYFVSAPIKKISVCKLIKE